MQCPLVAQVSPRPVKHGDFCPLRVPPSSRLPTTGVGAMRDRIAEMESDIMETLLAYDRICPSRGQSPHDQPTHAALSSNSSLPWGPGRQVRGTRWQTDHRGSPEGPWRKPKSPVAAPLRGRSTPLNLTFKLPESSAEALLEGMALVARFNNRISDRRLRRVIFHAWRLILKEKFVGGHVASASVPLLERLRKLRSSWLIWRLLVSKGGLDRRQQNWQNYGPLNRTFTAWRFVRWKDRARLVDNVIENQSNFFSLRRAFSSWHNRVWAVYRNQYLDLVSTSYRDSFWVTFAKVLMLMNHSLVQKYFFLWASSFLKEKRTMFREDVAEWENEYWKMYG
eukprot:GEMP01033554.1.p1 GENE.GEMP01033554.1~~GEMP01033554.1.p1  ORF type:complete len:337 (+),score=51.54 GEMP01033554.1:392-1402(+)